MSWSTCCGTPYPTHSATADHRGTSSSACRSLGQGSSSSRVTCYRDCGHEPLDGIQLAPTPVSYVPGIALAALGSLAFGAVLGPEGPLIALGSAVAVGTASLFGIAPKGRQLLSAAGSFSAISALFGGPLVAAFMLIEPSAGIGTMLVPALLPGLVAAAVGYLTFIGVGPWEGLNAVSLSVPQLPHYNGTRVVDLMVAVVAGVLIALVIRCARRLGQGVYALRPRFPATALLGGAALVGVIALAAQALGATSDDVLFSGQVSVPHLLATGSPRVVVVLLVAKALCYAICLGCGFRGARSSQPSSSASA